MVKLNYAKNSSIQEASFSEKLKLKSLTFGRSTAFRIGYGAPSEEYEELLYELPYLWRKGEGISFYWSEVPLIFRTPQIASIFTCSKATAVSNERLVELFLGRKILTRDEWLAKESQKS